MQVNTTYRDIWQMAFPVMIGSIAITVLNITDTVFLGRVGEVELGASALGGVFYFIMVMIGVAIGTGTQIQIARRAGENNPGAIGKIFDQSLYLFLTLALVSFIILKFFSTGFFQFVIKEENLRHATFEFLKYRSIGIFFTMIAMSIRSFYVGIAAPKIWSVYSALLAALNIIFCYGFIFGNLGMPKMGIAGAGLASTISEFIGLVFLFIYTAMKPDIKQFHLFRFERIKMEPIAKTLTLSGPLVVQNFIATVAWFIFFLFVEKMGEHSLAISNITRSAYMVNMTPIWGFSVAANSMVSNIIGQGRGKEVMGMIHRIILLASAVSVFIIILCLIMPFQIMSIFTSDVNLINDSLGSLRVVALATFVFSYAIVCISAVSGTGATRTALYIEIAAIFIYLLYLWLAVFVFHASLEWVWAVEAVYWIFTGIVCYFYLKSMRWERIAV